MIIYQGQGVVDGSTKFVKGVVPLSGMAWHVTSTLGWSVITTYYTGHHSLQTPGP